MKEIQLTKGQVAKVCDCHAHLVEGRKWAARWKPTTNSFYAFRNTSVIERMHGLPRIELMHRVINNTPKGFETDHINHNTLDNQCSNLRTATRTQNAINQNKSKNNTTGYKGVLWRKAIQKWEAQIGVNRKMKYIGIFDTAEDAAKAYDEEARKLHGLFAKTNF